MVILQTGGVHRGPMAAMLVDFVRENLPRSRGHDWIVRPDGLILFAASPDMALSVDGPVQNGSSVVLRPHSGKPEPFNRWRWNSDGMLTLLGRICWAARPAPCRQLTGSQMFAKAYDMVYSTEEYDVIGHNTMPRLADHPSFDLNVKDGKLQNGASVIVWQTATAAKHNTWASEAQSMPWVWGPVCCFRTQHRPSSSCRPSCMLPMAPELE